MGVVSPYKSKLIRSNLPYSFVMIRYRTKAASSSVVHKPVAISPVYDNLDIVFAPRQS